MEITTLLHKPESKTLEFKRDLSSLNPILKTIIAFANTAGGTLVIGCSSQGKVHGISHVLKAEEALSNAIADSISPSLFPEIEIVTTEGKDLIIVKVPYWKAPFYLKKEGPSRGVYCRLGSTSRPAGAELLEELKRHSVSQTYDQKPIPELSVESLDHSLIEETFDRKIGEEKLVSLGVLVHFANRLVPSIGGMILFGREEVRKIWVPDARARSACFLGVDKTHILDQYNCEGSILQAIDPTLKFIARNTRLGADIATLYRVDIPEYPPLAVREALINALAHSDYSIPGSSIQIAIYNNRLEMTNPGIFPLGYTLEDFKSGVSRIRNRVIARVFHELYLMEEWGSGYKRIIDTCNSHNAPTPEWKELSSSMRVIFYPHTPSFALREDHHRTLSQREEIILSVFQEKDFLPFREIKKRLPIPLSERMLRYNLSELKEKGQIQSEGKGRGIVWFLIE